MIEEILSASGEFGEAARPGREPGAQRTRLGRRALQGQENSRPEVGRYKGSQEPKNPHAKAACGAPGGTTL